MAGKAAIDSGAAGGISHERAGRLFKLVHILAEGPTQRPQLVKRLKVGMRTFYRDVDLLRESKIGIDARRGSYRLECTLEEALHRLPFPDPELTFGDVMTLIKGRSSSHTKLRRFFQKLTK